MNPFLRRTIGLLIVIVLTLVTVGNVLADANSPVQTANLNLTYLINGMDLKPEQFNTTLKLTKDFLNQIDRSSKTLTKLTASQSSKLPMTTGAFEKITSEQYRFLTKMKEYHQNLIKTIGGEKAEQIFTAIYETIPYSLLPEKAVNQIKNLPSTPADATTSGSLNNMNNDDKQGHSGSKTEPEKENNMGNMPTGQMDPTNNMNKLDPMKMNDKNNTNDNNGMNSINNNTGINSMPGMNNMPSMNTNGNTSNPGGTGTVNEQLISQLQTSNALLTQMFSLMQKNGGISQTQLQPILQLLNNQQILIRLLSTNLSNTDTANGTGGSK